jgi:hypothetical protein
MLLGEKKDSPRERFLVSVLGNKPPGLNVWTKGKIKFSPSDVNPW